jgi:hypothetical protein
MQRSVRKDKAGWPTDLPPIFFAKDAKDWAPNICGQVRLKGVNHPPIVTYEEKPRAKALFV